MNKVVEEFFNTVLSQSPEWMAMLTNVENSRWHREAHTAAHTMMMISWYEQNCSNMRDERQQLLTELAILFHDFGKPPARVNKFSEERGHYSSFADHERVSARMFEHYMTIDGCKYKKMLGLTTNDVYAISFMIENHLPYKLGADAKRLAVQCRRRGIKTTIVKFINESNPTYATNVFYDLLLADQNGRISDNGEQELKEVEEWIAEFDQEKLTTFDLDPNKKVHFIIAPNSMFGAACRDQYFDQLISTGAYVVYVYDIKHNFYSRHNASPPHNVLDVEAYARENLNSYNQFAQAQYEQILLKGYSNVVVVGNFLTPKSRGMYVAMASKHKYKSVGVVVFDSLDAVKYCAHIQGVNESKIEKVVDRYFSVVLPIITSDFDEIIVKCQHDV